MNSLFIVFFFIIWPKEIFKGVYARRLAGILSFIVCALGRVHCSAMWSMVTPLFKVQETYANESSHRKDFCNFLVHRLKGIRDELRKLKPRSIRLAAKTLTKPPIILRQTLTGITTQGQ